MRLPKETWRKTAAAAVLLLFLAALLLTRTSAYEALREEMLDRMIGTISPVPATGRVAVVDIDRASLERIGPWPWPRERIAELVERTLSARPVAVGLDILIDGDDERSPAALAQRLADLTGAETVRALAASLPDGDNRLAAALKTGRVVAGLVLAPEHAPPIRVTAPVLIDRESDLSAIWEANGAAGPPEAVARAASGLGVIALAADIDGRVRRVALLALAGETPRPGLAAELVRVATAAATFVVSRSNELRIGSIAVPLGPDATLRLHPSAGGRDTLRAISAADLLEGSEQASRGLADRIVLVGSSAPELGGLRLAAGGALVPSVHLHARAVAQLEAGLHPRRPAGLATIETGALAALALAGLAVGLLLSPIGALTAMGIAGLAWIVLAGLALRLGQILVDPLAPSLAGVLAAGLTVALAVAAARRREAQLRQRFAQHLAPELVTRLVETPELLKLEGETREVTIIFTDVEGFTAMTERSDPGSLIRVLDRYIDEMSAIVVAHGGMVEKIVGDGFHALFNAPLDLANHEDKAIACARAIHTFSTRFQAEAEPKALGFGRTRVGVETGPVIVGDVGGGTRLDYTAYGNAMNTAARLEAANKEVASDILIGPTTAAGLTDKTELRPLGHLEVRGRSAAMAVYDLWPESMTLEARRLWSAALSHELTAPRRAAAELAGLSTICGTDPVRDALIARLSGRAG